MKKSEKIVCFAFWRFGCIRCFGIEAPTPETPETHHGDQVPSFFQAGSHRAQWDLVWFGLGKDADSRLYQNKTWKKNETYVNKTNLLDGQERPSLGILDIIGKIMWPCFFFFWVVFQKHCKQLWGSKVHAAQSCEHRSSRSMSDGKDMEDSKRHQIKTLHHFLDFRNRRGEIPMKPWRVGWL